MEPAAEFVQVDSRLLPAGHREALGTGSNPAAARTRHAPTATSIRDGRQEGGRLAYAQASS